MKAQVDGILEDKFQKFSEYPREVVYTHINKSVFLKGEMLGFKTYVLDKFAKTPSTATTNIYCTLSDENGTIIKQKLLRVQDGTASNNFIIDSSFTSGIYHFKAYTNWMRNFEEPNFSHHSITIIDPDHSLSKNQKSEEADLDIQLLPEGGELIEGVDNAISIIIKDKDGLGVANEKGLVKDSNDNVITEFQLNEMGISKVVLKPTKKDIYKFQLIDMPGQFRVLKDPKPLGFNLSVSTLRDRLLLSFKTNQSSLPRLNKNLFKLVVHNGNSFFSLPFKFDNDLNINKVLSLSELDPGVNIITVLDSAGQPILERLFFNDEGFDYNDIVTSVIRKEIDSTVISINTGVDIDLTKNNAFSISVLPAGTNSIQHETSIMAKVYLLPYLNGFVENASYYFSNNSGKVKYDMDLLLMSQGWSSYDWMDVLNNPPLISYPFEFGISTQVTINSKNPEGVYTSMPLKNNSSEIFSVSEDENSFYQKGLFPLQGETYNLSKSESDNRRGSLNYIVQFFPNKFPEFSQQLETYFQGYISRQYNSIDSSVNEFWGEDVEKLEAVIVEANRSETKIEKINSKYIGSVDLFDDRMRKSSLTFARYIEGKGYKVQELFGNLQIENRNPATPNNAIPIIFLDNQLLADFSVLANYRMENVDYVVIDKMGSQMGVRGAGGVIRIFTDNKFLLQSNKKANIASLEFPLSFASQKQFYIPKYQSYQSDFFKKYGVIDWIPNLKISSNGVITFKIKNITVDQIKFHLQGWANGNRLIQKTMDITLED